mmetsp:Transcript_22384/g.26412  ORF Transcript_22384/g.26412 Transcript_22384/m.26412 type:complete len:250 (-) Transcript_22384:83-832(-)
MASETPVIVFVVGSPSVGKTTLCERTENEFGYAHLIVDDIFRNERTSGSLEGNEIDRIIKSGKNIPPQITVNLIRKAIDRNITRKFIIDGFPMDIDCLHTWNKEMNHCCSIQFCIHLNCSKKVLEERHALHKKSNNSILDIDDTQQMIQSFPPLSDPFLDSLQSSGHLITIDTEKDREMVYINIRRFFQENNRDSFNVSPSFEEDKNDDEVLALVYEAPDGFRGSYSEVAAHEEMLERNSGVIVNALHD